VEGVTLGRLIGVGDVAGMVALRAQVGHSELPPKGCMVVRVAITQVKLSRSADLQIARESVNYLGNLHNSVGTSVLLRVAHFPHSLRRTEQPPELDNRWILDVDI
jgi:hypothetical protein